MNASAGAPCMIIAAAAWFAATVAVQAAIVEQVFTLPVEVVDRDGAKVRQQVTVTVFRDDARPRSRFMILNHGRPGQAGKRAEMQRVRYTGNARYFVSKGFAVFVPTRIGYGVTGGPDVENSGRCSARNFPPVYEAAAQISLRVIEHAKSLPYIDPARGIVAGQSFGGMTAIALAAKNVPGVVAAVNFAGGGGGDPKNHPGRPCSEDRLRQLFRAYGKSARIPTLWLYSENDMYWGNENPKAWLQAFQASGGKGQFVPLPTSGEDGHPIFTRSPEAWRPAFEAFLSKCCGD